MTSQFVSSVPEVSTRRRKAGAFLCTRPQSTAETWSTQSEHEDRLPNGKFGSSAVHFVHRDPGAVACPRNCFFNLMACCWMEINEVHDLALYHFTVGGQRPLRVICVCLLAQRQVSICRPPLGRIHLGLEPELGDLGEGQGGPPGKALSFLNFEG